MALQASGSQNGTCAHRPRRVPCLVPGQGSRHTLPGAAAPRPAPVPRGGTAGASRLAACCTPARWGGHQVVCRASDKADFKLKTGLKRGMVQSAVQVCTVCINLMWSSGTPFQTNPKQGGEDTRVPFRPRGARHALCHACAAGGGRSRHAYMFFCGTHTCAHRTAMHRFTTASRAPPAGSTLPEECCAARVHTCAAPSTVLRS